MSLSVNVLYFGVVHINNETMINKILFDITIIQKEDKLVTLVANVDSRDNLFHTKTAPM